MLAVSVGLGEGLGPAAFRRLAEAATRLFSGYADYAAAAAGAANPHLPWLGRWFVLATPVVAALVYGPLVHRLAREARGHGVPEAMYVVAERGGRIRPTGRRHQGHGQRDLYRWRRLGGTGGTDRPDRLRSRVGARPVAPTSGVAPADPGRLRRRRRHRVTFNTPIAGVFFALELILAEFAEFFAAVVLAAVSAAALSRAVFEDQPFLALPPFSITSVWQYPAFSVLGLLAAGMGVLWSRTPLPHRGRL